MAKTHNLRVNITENGTGGYRATIDVDSQPSRPAHRINWFFDAPDDFPSNSVLYVRFFRRDGSGAKLDDDGCMHGGAWSGGIGEALPNGRSITGKVKNSARGTFTYEIKYRLELGGDYELVDPEIVVDGAPDPGPVGGTKRPARATQKAKQPAAKKARKVKTAGKRKTAKQPAKAKAVSRKTTRKPAKRAAARKAKKR